MAVTLGKRKRVAEKVSDSQPKRDESESDDDDAARRLFQQAFEAKFKPLETKLKSVEEPSEEESDDDTESDVEGNWDGLSENEEELRVEIVQHAEPKLENNMDRIFDRKAFMSSKPPKLDDSNKKAVAKILKRDAVDEDGAESANLKHDLELQRLLKESHLLHPSAFHGSSSAPEGKGRLKALDMRLQDLGAKTSVLQQEKMPLSHRKGIASKSANREASRRKEATENGIILERARSNAPKIQKRRERGIGNPGIGKFRGATLSLSSRDIKSIQSSKSDARGRKGKRK